MYNLPKGLSVWQTGFDIGIAKQKQNVPAKAKIGALRWRGVLHDRKRTLRVMVAALLALACVSLTFVQLGFAGIGLPGDYVAYAVVLLEPIALGAILLGTLAGMVLGLFAGVVLCVHAVFLPLNIYELSFVTPVTSIAMLGLSGFFLGIFFAIALRNDPSRPRRIIYIIIVCFIISWLYSLSFYISVFVRLLVEIATNPAVADMPEAELAPFVQQKAASVALRAGSVRIQAWVDAISMALVCGVGDYVAGRIVKFKGNRGLRDQAGSWLFVVFLATFMVTSVLSFLAITQDDYKDAESTMYSEVNYLCKQIEESDNRTDSLWELLEKLGVDTDKLSDDEFESATRTVSMTSLLEGYTPDVDGTLFVTFSEGFILLTDDPLYEGKGSLSDCFTDEVLEAIDRSTETGGIESVVVDRGWTSSLDAESINDAMNSSSAYLLAKNAGIYSVIIIMPEEMVYADRNTTMMTSTISELALLLVMFGLVSRLLNRLVVRRVDEMNDVLGRITGGDLDARVEVHDTREFESLSSGINETVVALKGWIAEAETRMDAELATAKAIQESALPRIFPPYPDIIKFDIYAIMHPAREVGGDFYDFFLIGSDAGPDAGKLGFVVADVSGKGVPAALFMMNAKALVRGYLESGMQPGEALENANRQLCDGNDASMFVTVWAGVLDYATGRVEFANAGHNPPLLWQRDSWRWLKEKSGLPLGLFDGMPYRTYELDCGIGDQFLVYSDGVTEAMNAEEAPYGEDRLEQIAEDNYTLHPRALIEAVRRDVAKHVKGAEQSDDITILALEVGVPPEITATLTVPARVEELTHVNEFIHTELDRRLCPLRTQNQLDIAVEELFVNVARYAYPDATPEQPGTVRVSYSYSADPPSIEVDIADKGIPYDPLAKPDAVTPEDIADVPIGGLGILMAKRSVDEMRYERVDDSNIVTVVKRW